MVKRLFLLLLVSPICLAGSSYHVTTTGSWAAAGTQLNPWNLEYAFYPAPALVGGDTVWVHAGRYYGWAARGILCNIIGDTLNHVPVVVRNWNNERVIFDAGDTTFKGALWIEGAREVYFWGIELADDPSDRSSLTESGAGDASDVDIGYGQAASGGNWNNTGIKLINMVAHDVVQGFSNWASMYGCEIYGCLVFNYGYNSSDRGTGHAMYVQNDESKKLIENNLCLPGFGGGIQVYGSSAAQLDSVTVRKNLAIREPWLATSGNWSYQYLYGGGGTEDFKGDTTDGNVFYRDFTILDGDHRGARHGYNTGSVGSVITNNFMIREYKPLTIDDDTLTIMTGNWIIGSSWEGYDTSDFPDNVWMVDPPETGDTVFVWPNRYEEDRGHVIILNWDSGDSVTVNLSSILESGDSFYIYSAQDIFNDEPITGQYAGGTMNFPMMASRWSPTQPIAWTDKEQMNFFPKFGAFIVNNKPLPQYEGPHPATTHKRHLPKGKRH